MTKCPDAYTVFLNRCVPKQLITTAVGLFTNTGAQSLVEEVVQDLEIAWKEIIYMGLIALGEGSCLVHRLFFRPHQKKSRLKKLKTQGKDSKLK